MFNTLIKSFINNFTNHFTNYFTNNNFKLNIYFLISLFFLFNSCKSKNNILDKPLVNTQNNKTITDMLGRKVSIPVNPKKIVCLAPGTLRLISYMGLANKVVGIEEMEKKFPVGRPYYLANKEYFSLLPTIGPGGPASINKKPDMEAILKVKPDIIFITLMDKFKADQIQSKFQIPIVVLSYGRFASFDPVVFKSLHLIGEIFNKKNRSNEIDSYIQKVKTDLSNRLKSSISDKKVYIGGLGFKGAHGIESTDSRYIPFDWLNANNVVKVKGKIGHTFINKEELLNLDPRYIFIDGGGYSLIKQDFLKHKNYYNSLSAFKNDNVYKLFPFNWYTTNIGTVIINTYFIAKVLAPSVFEDINIVNKANEVYSFFVTKNVYKDMLENYGDIGQKF